MSKFKPGQSGNLKGRPKGSTRDARKVGAEKLKKLLRALEPVADDSILVAAEIMNDTKASQATRLKAATTLLQKYTELTGEVYGNLLPTAEKEAKKVSSVDDDSEGEEDDEPQGNLALFSSKEK